MVLICCYNHSGRLPKDVILQPHLYGHSKAMHAHPNNNHALPVGGHDVRDSSKSFALQWQVFSSEVGKLRWLAFYLKKERKKKAVIITQCVPTRSSQDGKCHWSVFRKLVS